VCELFGRDSRDLGQGHRSNAVALSKSKNSHAAWRLKAAASKRGERTAGGGAVLRACLKIRVVKST